MFQNLLLLLPLIVISIMAAPIGLVAHDIGIATTGVTTERKAREFARGVEFARSEPPVASATAKALVTGSATALYGGHSSVPPHPTAPFPGVECMSSGHAPSHPVTTLPPNVLVQRADNSTVQPSTSASSAFSPLPLSTDATDGSQSVSAKVTFGIIFGISLFLAVNLALFCLWHKRCRGVRQLPSTRSSRSRVSSQTMVGDDTSVKSSVADGWSLEMKPGLPLSGMSVRNRTERPATVPNVQPAQVAFVQTYRYRRLS
ncbi:hypothetical protein B0H17DRAFT_1215561 [Mycena rosella]|uniref:Transmembrane protein n=1 Tax=Mycena rosella TaxID=1033263 RepID=A0AAD7CH82_MYCRO|nr:hypothetical protein B0H17DRAFT_1215561 [Mycena rosella]